MRVFRDKGLNISFNGLTIGLDSQSSSSDFSFLSHAHTDHLIKRPVKPVIASELTGLIAEQRLGYSYDLINSLPNVSLIDSGHIVGSKSLLINDGVESFLYTGDFTVHDRFFLKGLRPVRVDNLFIETTYGSPDYDLPLPSYMLAHARDVIEDDLANGYRVVLWGYALGKAQILTKLVEGLGPVVADESVRSINAVCRASGVDVGVPAVFNRDFSGVFITPKRSDLSRFTDARVYSFTGWGFRGVSDCFPLSDHAGFSDLLRFVRACRPKRVFTHHGFASEFASLLRVEGFDAVSV